MTKKITQERIILFVYGELPFDETAVLFDQIDTDPESLDYLESIAGIGTLLSSLRLVPSQSLPSKIMSFSSQFTQG